MDATNMSLSQVLSTIGWTHAKHTTSAKQGRDVWNDKGEHMGVLDACDCWFMLRQLGLVDDLGALENTDRWSLLRSIAQTN